MHYTIVRSVACNDDELTVRMSKHIAWKDECIIRQEQAVYNAVLLFRVLAGPFATRDRKVSLHSGKAKSAGDDTISQMG